MVILVDTNIILDFVARRPFYQAAKEIMEKCSTEELTGYVALYSIPTIWYVLRKMPETERRQILLDVCDLLQVASVDHNRVVEAIEAEDFHDFEDCLQDKCAVSVGADYIVTRNISDYSTSEVPAILPEELLKELSSNQKQE